jgi:NMD protein affecting ribosome stability and mRNA decay
MVCPRCGAQIEAQDKFCDACGAPAGPVRSQIAASTTTSGAIRRCAPRRSAIRRESDGRSARPCRRSGGHRIRLATVDQRQLGPIQPEAH